jgi:hypothetical protein
LLLLTNKPLLFLRPACRFINRRLAKAGKGWDEFH